MVGHIEFNGNARTKRKTKRNELQDGRVVRLGSWQIFKAERARGGCK